jgi:RNA polymerase sigma-70 factor (ECF subfamily)
LLDLVFQRLREEFLAAGKLPVFDRLKQFLAVRPKEMPYREVADELAMSEGAVKVAVHRMRRRYRDLLKEEIAQTVASPESQEDELRELLAALGSGK